MAETDTGQERTEQPSAKRLEEARSRGQVPRSRDLSTAAVVLIAGIGLRTLGGDIIGKLDALMQSSLTLSRAQSLDESSLLPELVTTGSQALMICAPVLGLTLLAALASPLALGGWTLSFGALAPDFTRLNPVPGFQRMLSMNGLTELAKAFAKFLLIATFAVIFLWSKRGEMLQLGTEPLNSAIAHTASITGEALLTLAGALALIAAIDVPIQLWRYTKEMKMSRAELREEAKESDGSPEVKGRIRRMQQEASRRRMMQKVPTADVVVVNPTHYSVALRYDEARMRAPVVVAKGVDEVAANIRKIATENNVPIFEAPPLARVLFREVDLDAEVPASLYVAVAQVLTYVYQLRNALRIGAPAPKRPDIDADIEAVRN
jgi:flagellar biosynthesis protein FlhB